MLRRRSYSAEPPENMIWQFGAAVSRGSERGEARVYIMRVLFVYIYIFVSNSLLSFIGTKSLLQLLTISIDPFSPRQPPIQVRTHTHARTMLQVHVVNRPISICTTRQSIPVRVFRNKRSATDHKYILPPSPFVELRRTFSLVGLPPPLCRAVICYPVHRSRTGGRPGARVLPALFDCAPDSPGLKRGRATDGHVYGPTRLKAITCKFTLTELSFRQRWKERPRLYLGNNYYTILYCYGIIRKYKVFDHFQR